MAAWSWNFLVHQTGSLTLNVFLKLAIVSSHFACPMFLQICMLQLKMSKSAEDLFFARGLLTALPKQMANAQERHSCRGKRLNHRSRHRRDEALSPGAHRKVARGRTWCLCHRWRYRGKTDLNIAMCSRRQVCRSVDGLGSEKLQDIPLSHRGWRKGCSRQFDLCSPHQVWIVQPRNSEGCRSGLILIWQIRSQNKASEATTGKPEKDVNLQCQWST